MKLFSLIALLLLAGAWTASLFAQNDATAFPAVVEQIIGSDATLTVSTFLGITSLISLIVTQIAKKAPIIADSAPLKILVAVSVGVAVSIFAWWIEAADFLNGLLWWQVVIQGLIAGLTACGLYDILKNILPKTPAENEKI